MAPCTTTIRGLPSEVVLDPGEDPVPRRSAVNLDSIESVAVAVLVERIGRLADMKMQEVCAALEVAVDMRISNRRTRTVALAEFESKLTR